MASTEKHHRTEKSAAKGDLALEAGGAAAQKPASSFPALFLVLLILIAYGFWLYRIDGNPLASKEETVQEILTPAMDEQTKAKLEAASNQLALASDEIQSLAAQVSALAAELESLRNAPPPMAVSGEGVAQGGQETITQLQSAISELQSRLDIVQARQSEQVGVHASKLLTLQLIDRIETLLLQGKPYQSKFEELNALASTQGLEADALEHLALFAEIGISTLAELNESFEDVAQIAIPVSLQVKEDPSLADRVRSRLSHVVSIRKTEENITDDDNSDEAVIARASAALNGGNVALAISQLELLGPESGLLFTKWKEQAAAYQKTWAALDRLKSAMYATPTQE